MVTKSVRFNQTVQVHAHAITLGCYSGGSGSGPPVQLDWNCVYQMECPLSNARPLSTQRLTPRSSMQRIERLLDAGIDVNEIWNAEAIANVVRMQRRESSMDHLKELPVESSTDHLRKLSPQGKRALRGFMARRR